MTTVATDLTESWAEITTAASFVAQNVSLIDIEIARKSSLPSASERGIILKTKHGLDDSTGSGNLYARRLGGTIVVMT